MGVKDKSTVAVDIVLLLKLFIDFAAKMEAGMMEVAQQLQDNPELAQLVKRIEAQNQMKAIVNKLTSECWDKCVDKPGNSLGRQESCLCNCAERFFDTDQLIRQRMEGNAK